MDITERLRKMADSHTYHPVGELWNGLEEAADEIDRLRARIAELERHKQESLSVLGPVIDYARGLGITKLGGSLTDALIKDHVRLADLEGQEPVASRDEIIQCLIATRGQSEGVTADAILSMLAAAPPAVPEWQPIETVPTDGQEIRGRTGNGTIIDRLSFAHQGHWWWDAAEKEIYSPTSQPWAMLREAGIVEWMPLPAAPKPEGDER